MPGDGGGSQCAGPVDRYAKMCTNVKEMVIKSKTRQEQSADTWIAKVG